MKLSIANSEVSLQKYQREDGLAICQLKEFCNTGLLKVYKI